MVTSSADIRNALESLMQRGMWYTIPELESLALTVFTPDQEDMVVRGYVYDNGAAQSPEWTFKRQVKNAVQPWRANNHEIEYIGARGDPDSRYSIPVDSALGVTDLEVLDPQEIAELTGAAEPNYNHYSNNGFGAEQFVLRHYTEQGFHGLNVRHRNFGFDLQIWPEHADRADPSVYQYVEVKSCSTGRTRPLLTANEWAAAHQYGGQYIVVCVDNWDGEQGDLVFLESVTDLEHQEIQTMSYRVQRTD